ncbi:hypothetical protein ACS0TY_005809 [Phlomoides rotata]
MNNSQEDVYICPSFNSYSSDRLAEIAVRVAGDKPSGAAGNDSDDDFEFDLVREHTAEEFFYDGQIQPVFPVFNRDLLKSDGESGTGGGENKLTESESSVVISLSQLFIEEDSVRDSCSSSEADESEDIPAGAYCVWRPKMAELPLPSQCKKSRSTGSGSKRWKIRDLLRRSKSDGNESLVFLTPKHRVEKPDNLVGAPKRVIGKGSQSATGAPPSAHEAFYVRNRAMKEEDKKKSYLPYRQDLVGLFANVNGVRRSVPHY